MQEQENHLSDGALPGPCQESIQRSNRRPDHLANGEEACCPFSKNPIPISARNTSPQEFVFWYPEFLFLPRDAMHKRSLCCRPVSICLSVCPSVTFVACIQAAKDIVKQLLPRQSSPIALVFDPQRDTQFQGEPLQRGAKYKGVGNFCDFRLKSPSISKTVRDRPMVAMER